MWYRKVAENDGKRLFYFIFPFFGSIAVMPDRSGFKKRIGEIVEKDFGTRNEKRYKYQYVLCTRDEEQKSVCSFHYYIAHIFGNMAENFHELVSDTTVDWFRKEVAEKTNMFQKCYSLDVRFDEHLRNLVNEGVLVAVVDLDDETPQPLISGPELVEKLYKSLDLEFDGASTESFNRQLCDFRNKWLSKREEPSYGEISKENLAKSSDQKAKLAANVE